MKHMTKKTKTRLLSGALCLAMMAGLAPAASAHGLAEGLPNNPKSLAVTTLTVTGNKASLSGTKVGATAQTLYLSYVELFRLTDTLTEGDFIKGLTGESYHGQGDKLASWGSNAKGVTGYTGTIGASFEVNNIQLPALTPITESSTEYFRKYAVGLTHNSAGNDYAASYMYIDSEGSSATWNESYMTRYKRDINFTGVNANLNVSGMPKEQIISPLNAATAVPGSNPTLPGFEFKGWNKSASTEAAPNTAAGLEPAVDIPATGGSFTPASVAANTIYDLYAVWKPIMVTAVKGTESDTPAANKPYTYTGTIGGAEGTTKTVTVTEGDLPTGLEANSTAVSNGEQILITGTPRVVVPEETNVVLTVTDNTNKTSVTVPIKISPIAAGYQKAPRMDWNSGLVANGVTKTGDKDGEIGGLYPAEALGDDIPGYENANRVYEYRAWKSATDYDAASEDDRKLDTNWTTYRAVTKVDDTTATLADQSGLAEEQRTPGSVTHVLNLEGTEPQAGEPDTRTGTNAFFIQGLDEGVYQVRFAAKEKDPNDADDTPFSASDPTVIRLGVGKASGGSTSAAGGKILFALGDSAMAGDAATEGTDANKFQAFLKTLEGAKENTVVRIPEQVPVRKGSEFAGWADGSKADGGAYLLYKYSAEENAPQSSIKLGAGQTVLIPVWNTDLKTLTTLNFYDWDRSLIGFTMIPKSDVNATTVGEAITAFETANKANEVDQYGYANDATKPLTNKAGYKFEGVWINNESDEFECYKLDDASGYSVEPPKHDAKTTYVEKNQLNVSDAVSGLQNQGKFGVRATYLAQTNLDRFSAGVDTGEEDLSTNYTMKNLEYTRNGRVTANSGTYVARFDLVRSNVHGNPVSRLRAPVIHAMTKAGTVPVTTKVEIKENGDSVYVELLTDKMATSFEFLLRETYKQPSWTAGTVYTTVTGATSTGEKGYRRLGTMTYLYELCVILVEDPTNAGALEEWRVINYVDFMQELQLSGASPGNGSTYKTKLLAAVKDAIKTHNHTEQFTYSQFEYAVKNGTIFNGDTMVP